MSENNKLTLSSFRNSLGLFGLDDAPYLADRIYSIICMKRGDFADFDDFLHYLDVLINGNDEEKALQSFMILDFKKNGKIYQEDINRMVEGVCVLWNLITETKKIVSPSKQFLQKLFEAYDRNGDGVITVDEYIDKHSNKTVFLDWYEFLNSNEGEITPLIKISSFVQAGSENNDGIDFNEIEDPKSLKISLVEDIQKNISDLLLKLKDQELALPYKSADNEYFMEKKEKHGPIVNKNSMESIKGEGLQELEDLETEIEKMQPFNILDCSISDLDLNQPYDHPNSYLNEIILCGETLRILSEITRLKNILKRLIINNEEEVKTNSQGMKIKKSFFSNENEENELILPEPKILSKSNSMPIYLKNSIINERRATLRNIPSQTLNSVRKQISIYFGHPNWNLVLNMMIGIRSAVKKVYRHGMELEEQDFKIKSAFEIIDKRSKEFDKRKSCKFYDYAPKVFEKLRNIFGIENEFYLRSIGPEQLLGDIIMGNLSSLTQFCSSGKSGSLFYYSFNGRFILKTISQNEFFFFRQILKNYYLYFNRKKDSLITKIFGLHKMKIYKSKTKVQKIYLIIMENLITNSLTIDIKYDLKGSLYGRTARADETKWDRSIALKDLDFLEDGMKIFLSEQELAIFKTNIEKDCEFLKNNNIIDYSLFVAIHWIPKSKMIKHDLPDKAEIGVRSGDKSKIYILGIIDNFTLNTKTIFNDQININEVEFTNNEYKVLKESPSNFFDPSLSSQKIKNKKSNTNASIIKNETQFENQIALSNQTNNTTSANLNLPDSEILNVNFSQINITENSIQLETEKKVNLTSFNPISNFSSPITASFSAPLPTPISTLISTPTPTPSSISSSTPTLALIPPPIPTESSTPIAAPTISNLNKTSDKERRKASKYKKGKKEEISSSVLISTLLSNLTRTERNDHISWRIRNHLLNNSINEEIALKRDLEKMGAHSNKNQKEYEDNNNKNKRNLDLVNTKKCGDCEILQNEKVESFLKNDSCFSFTNCKECANQKECGWCPKIGLCVGGDGEGPFYGKCEWYQFGVCKERCLKYLDCFSCKTDRDCEWCIADQFSTCADKKFDNNLLCKKIVPTSQQYCPKSPMIGKDQLNQELQVREWEQEIPIKISQKDGDKNFLRDSLGILVDQNSIRKILNKKEEKIKKLKEAQMKTDGFFAGRHLDRN